MGRRPRNPEKTVRKWIKGGCRKCRKQAENHGRGLCGVCYAREAEAGRLDAWPKVAGESLLDRPEAAPGLPFPASPAPQTKPAPEPLTVTLTIPPEGRFLWERLEREARELWRPLPYQLLHRLSVAWMGSREAVRP